MRQTLALFMAFVALFAVSLVPVSAQDIDVAFSDEKLRELGYPEVEINVGPEGVTAPSTLESGYYLISFSSTGEYSGYLNIMQPPADLDEETATELALAAARDDLAQPGWGYVGGTNTFETGVPVSFAMYLEPGEYSIAASYYLPEQGSEEIMTLVPLTVTGSSATPSASAVMATPQATPVASAAPVADVTLEMTDDLKYIVSPNVVPAGPQLWEIINTGSHHSHHVVMFGIPDGTTAG